MVDPGYHMLYKGAIPISKTSHCVYAYRVSLNGESDTAVEPLGSRAYGLIPSTGTRFPNIIHQVVLMIMHVQAYTMMQNTGPGKSAHTFLLLTF